MPAICAWAAPSSSPASMPAMSAGDGAAVDVDQQAADRLRLFGGDLLDIHAAFGGEQDQRLARLRSCSTAA